MRDHRDRPAPARPRWLSEGHHRDRPPGRADQGVRRQRRAVGPRGGLRHGGQAAQHHGTSGRASRQAPGAVPGAQRRHPDGPQLLVTSGGPCRRRCSADHRHVPPAGRHRLRRPDCRGGPCGRVRREAHAQLRGQHGRVRSLPVRPLRLSGRRAVGLRSTGDSTSSPPGATRPRMRSRATGSTSDVRRTTTAPTPSSFDSDLTCCRGPECSSSSFWAPMAS